MLLTALDANNPLQSFPPASQALIDPNGLLAIGGCLSPQRLINAYQSGIFPWYNPGEPILWWSPDPRMVLFPQRLQISRSLHKQLRNHAYRIRFDSAFAEVMAACAAPRQQHSGTWINPQMRQAYHQLHQCGVAHSFEAWEGDELIAGLYGVAIGQVFFGESMFHRRSNASKIVFAHLVQQLQSWGYGLIDCQVSSTHLQSLGAEEISREHFLSLLLTGCKTPPHSQAWQA